MHVSPPSIMDIDKDAGADSSFLVDVIDRVLDKGIVVDASMRISLGGIDLITIEACLVVASIDTCLTHGPEWRESVFRLSRGACRRSGAREGTRAPA